MGHGRKQRVDVRLGGVWVGDVEMSDSKYMAIIDEAIAAADRLLVSANTAATNNPINQKPVGERKGRVRRLRTRCPHPATIELMCGNEDDAYDLWRAIYPTLRARERGET